jgi:hypothetical protein
MKNFIIGARETSDIDAVVAKTLRGLGNPEPPLDLVDVRVLRELDVRYFSTADDSALREMASRIRVASKQLAMRPRLLLDVVRKAELSALWLPDRMRILIDADVHPLRHRWLEAHEHGHQMCEWHGRYAYGDDVDTLDPACRHATEAEANYAGGQLIFLAGRFLDEANDLPICFDSIHELKKTFGNTISSTLWRFVEEAHSETPMVGIISANPHRPPKDFDPAVPCKHVIESPSFREGFGNSTELSLFGIVTSYCRRARGGPLGEKTTILTDCTGEPHEFHFESFSNRHAVLTLARHIRQLPTLVSVS